MTKVLRHVVRVHIHIKLCAYHCDERMNVGTHSDSCSMNKVVLFSGGYRRCDVKLTTRRLRISGALSPSYFLMAWTGTNITLNSASIVQ
jgi:hypothetical protein